MHLVLGGQRCWEPARLLQTSGASCALLLRTKELPWEQGGKKKREGGRMVLGAEPGAGRQRERLAVLLCVLPSGSFACERRRGRKGKKGEEEKKK